MKKLKYIIMAFTALAFVACSEDEDETPQSSVNTPDASGVYIGDFTYNGQSTNNVDEVYEDVKLIISDKDGDKYLLSSEDGAHTSKIQVPLGTSPHKVFEVKNTGTGYFNGGISGKYYGDSIYITSLHLEDGTSSLIGASKIMAHKQK